jgi:predicted MFS family arabinose efflux permease
MARNNETTMKEQLASVAAMERGPRMGNTYESPSRRSLVSLDALYFILADVRGGLGPFLAVYLASVHHWDPARIGLAMGVMGFAGLASQAPAGALIDHSRNKRALVAAAFAVVAAGALAMVMKPTPVVVLSAQVLIGMVGATFGPALAAISLGLVGYEGLARRMGRNHYCLEVSHLELRPESKTVAI